MNLGKNYWASKKVSITGHAGLKGSWLLLWILKKGACFYSYLFRSNLKVKVLIDAIKNQIPIKFKILNNQKKYESKLLFLSSEKARRSLSWEPKLKFNKSLVMTLSWYKSYLKDRNTIDCFINDLNLLDEI